MEDEIIDIDVTGGYYPSTGYFPPRNLWNTIKAGQNLWVRAGNNLQGANGAVQLSATNVGARIFPLNDSRAEIAGGLVSGRLPYSSIIRLPGGVFLFLSEQISQQVYVNETALAGVTTSGTAGILRVAIPDGVGGYNVYDAGFDPPVLPSANVSSAGGGVKGMAGNTGVALCAWRTTTNAISAPSNIVYQNLPAGNKVGVDLASTGAVTGQDGWIMAGSNVGVDDGILKVVRYIYITVRGTFTATNGSPNIGGGIGTFFLRDLRAGDFITIDAASYTILSVDSQSTLTLTANFAGTTNPGKTATITDAAAEWYDGELGELLDFNVFRPVSAAGLFQFMSRVLLWGTAGDSASAVTGPAIHVLLENNPEHIGLFNVTTTFGDDLLNLASSGDNRSNNLFLMTRNTLEIVTLDPTGAYRIRVKQQPGFSNPKCGVVYKDIFYGFAQRPFRTEIEANTDVDFGIPVLADMNSWNSDNVTMGVDAKNEAVLYAQYDGGATTTIIPYLPQLGVWNPPIYVTGQITDWATVNGITYAIVLTGGNYRVYTWEGGAGMTGMYIGTQYINDGGRRFKLKGVMILGHVSDLYTYIADNTGISNVTDTFGATAHFTLSGGVFTLQPEIFTNLKPGKGVAHRLEFPTDTSVLGLLSKLSMHGYFLETRH